MSKTDGVAALPLNAIRVFVEAARQRSFSRAAQVLGMTQSGVSHHVASLERHLGLRLFLRSGATVELTDTGRQYFDTIHEAFSTIEWSTRQLAQRPDGGRLIVRTSLPTFAMTVVIPALSRFSIETPVSVDLVTSLSAPSSGDVFDVLLTRDLDLDGDAHWRLAEEMLVCVAAPELQAQYAALEVSAWPFVAARSRPDAVAAWVKAQAIDASAIRVVASFEHYFLALPAAIAGMGYLVVPQILVAEPLRLGRLVDAGLPTVRGGACYKAWVNPRSGRLAAADAFCRWLKGELRSSTVA